MTLFKKTHFYWINRNSFIRLDLYCRQHSCCVSSTDQHGNTWIENQTLTLAPESMINPWSHQATFPPIAWLFFSSSYFLYKRKTSMMSFFSLSLFRPFFLPSHRTVCFSFSRATVPFMHGGRKRKNKLALSINRAYIWLPFPSLIKHWRLVKTERWAQSPRDKH